MKLSHDMIEAAARGCISLERDGDGVRFVRLPEPLRETWRAMGEGKRVRVDCPSGVRLRFRAAASDVRVSMRFGAAARPFFSGAVLVDGGAPQAFGPIEVATEWSGSIVGGLDGSSRLFDIWLPHLAETTLDAIEIDGDGFEPVAPEGPRWLLYGDSITQGMTVPLPTQALAARAALESGADMLNLGVGGAECDAHLAETAPPMEYDIVTIAFGTNDFNHGVDPKQYADNARNLVKRLAAARPGQPIYVITVIPWAGRTEGNENGHVLDDFRTALRPLEHEAEECRIVEGAELIANDAALFADGVHPNEAGMASYAEGLAPLLKS